MNTEAKKVGWRLLAYGWALAMMSLPATMVSAQTVNDGYDPNVTGRVRVIHGQGDGRLLIGGQVTQVGGVTRSRIARIHPDGSLDTDFAPVVTGGGAVGMVWAIHQQPGTVLGQGRILIGGLFDTVAGQPRPHLARLNANGTLDASFNVAVNNQVRAFHSTMAPDGLSGTIYIGGLFDNVQGQARSRVAAIQANGTLMTHFVPPIIGGQVWALAPHLGGGLLAAGGFNSVGGQASAPIVRLLTASGAADPGFNVSTSSANPYGNVINALAVLPDGRILIGGEFDTVNGQPRAMIARLLPDGTLDTSFVPPTLNGGVTGIDLQPDGRVVIVGEFTGLSGRDRIARLNADGSLDELFAELIAPNNLVHAVHVQQDGGVVLAGNFTHLTGPGLNRNRIARLDANGVVDRSWQITGATNQSIYDLAPLSDGRMMVGGAFTQFNGAARTRLARLTADGFVDSFAPTISSSVVAMAVLPDDRVLIGGGFTTVNGATRRRLALLNPDGSLDSSFNLDINDAVWALAVQPDGKVLVGGTFTMVAGQQRQRLFRLNANGTLDTGFNPPMFDDAIWVISVQPDGRILVGGDFQMLGGWPTKRLARLQASGQIDPSFQAEANGTVSALAQLANGTVLVGGNFTTIGDSNRSRLAALNGATGAVLSSFSGGANGQVQSILPRVDGKVYVAGSFTTIASGTRHRLALLTANGSLDAAFVNPSVNNSVIAMAPQRDGTLVIGGDFTQAGGSTRNGVARIRLRDGVQQSLTWLTGNEQLHWGRTGAGTTIAADTLGPPQVWISTECCDSADFIPVPGGSLMTRTGTSWTLTGFSGLYDTFYVKVKAPVGHRSTGLIETPIHQFDGGPAPGTDLAVIKTVTPTQASPGTQVTFTIQASNLGPNAATGVKVMDQLPSGYTYLSHTTTHGSYVPGTGVWQIGGLAAADAPSQAQMTVVATLNASGEHVNKAEIYGQQDDPIPENNLDTATVTVLPPPADLRVAFVEFTPAQASPGEVVEVQVRVHNVGPATPATGVQVASLLPAGLQFISSPNSYYDPVTGIWQLNTLPTGTVANLFINALVLPSGPYLHTATISGDQPDPQPGNNSASAELDVVLDEVIFANGFETPS